MKNSLKNNYSSIKFSELNKNDINVIFKELTSFYEKEKFYTLCQQIATYTGVAVLELMSMAEFASSIKRYKYPFEDYPLLAILILSIFVSTYEFDKINRNTLKAIKEELKKLKQQDIEYLQNKIIDISKDYNTNKVLFKCKGL